MSAYLNKAMADGADGQAAFGPGVTLGPYRILNRLSAGAMGVVYEAEHVRLRRHVALKTLTLRSDGTETREEQLERFLQEARVTARLNHAGIVAIHTLEVEPELQIPYFVMDLVAMPEVRRHVMMRTLFGSGRGWFRAEQETDADSRLKACSLQDVYSRARRTGRCPNPDIIRALLIEIAEALHYAHTFGEGVIHRDIKPANILIRPDGHAVIADFGVAKIVDRALQTSLRRGGASLSLRVDNRGEAYRLLLGTRDYMAPEMFEGGAPGPKTDMYAFGVMAYQLLSAHDFCGAARPLTDYGFPPGWAEAVGRCLKPDPGERWPDMRAVAEALRALPSNPLRRRRLRRRLTAAAALFPAVLAGGLALLMHAPAGERSFQDLPEGVRFSVTDDANGQTLACVHPDTCGEIDFSGPRAYRRVNAIADAARGSIRHPVTVIFPDGCRDTLKPMSAYDLAAGLPTNMHDAFKKELPVDLFVEPTACDFLDGGLRSDFLKRAAETAERFAGRFRLSEDGQPVAGRPMYRLGLTFDFGVGKIGGTDRLTCEFRGAIGVVSGPGAQPRPVADFRGFRWTYLPSGVGTLEAALKSRDNARFRDNIGRCTEEALIELFFVLTEALLPEYPHAERIVGVNGTRWLIAENMQRCSKPEALAARVLVARKDDRYIPLGHLVTVFRPFKPMSLQLVSENRSDPEACAILRAMREDSAYFARHELFSVTCGREFMGGPLVPRDLLHIAPGQAHAVIRHRYPDRFYPIAPDLDLLPENREACDQKPNDVSLPTREHPDLRSEIPAGAYTRLMPPYAAGESERFSPGYDNVHLWFSSKDIIFRENALGFFGEEGRDARIVLHVPKDARVSTEPQPEARWGALVLDRDGEQSLWRNGQWTDCRPLDRPDDGTLVVEADDPRLAGSLWTIRDLGLGVRIEKIDPGKHTDLRIPAFLSGKPVVSLGTGICEGNTTLRSLTAELHGRAEILDGALRNMKGLKRAKIDVSVSGSECRELFGGCSALQEVHLGLPGLGGLKNGFDGCTSLRYIFVGVLPKNPDRGLFRDVPDGCRLFQGSFCEAYTLKHSKDSAGNPFRGFIPDQKTRWILQFGIEEMLPPIILGDGSRDYWKKFFFLTQYRGETQVLTFEDLTWREATVSRGVVFLKDSNRIGEDEPYCLDPSAREAVIPKTLNGRKVSDFNFRNLMSRGNVRRVETLKVERLKYQSNLDVLENCDALRRLEITDVEITDGQVHYQEESGFSDWVKKDAEGRWVRIALRNGYCYDIAYSGRGLVLTRNDKASAMDPELSAPGLSGRYIRSYRVLRGVRRAKTGSLTNLSCDGGTLTLEFTEENLTFDRESLGFGAAKSASRLLILKVSEGARVNIDPKAFSGSGTLVLERAGKRQYFENGGWVNVPEPEPDSAPGVKDVSVCLRVNPLRGDQRTASWTVSESTPWGNVWGNEDNRMYQLLQYHPGTLVHGVVPAFLRGIATEFRKVPDVVFANCSRLETLTFEVNVDDTFTLDLLRPCTSLRRIVFTGSGPELPDGAILRRDAANRPIVIRLPNGRDYRIVKLDRQTVWETVGTPGGDDTDDDGVSAMGPELSAPGLSGMHIPHHRILRGIRRAKTGSLTNLSCDGGMLTLEFTEKDLTFDRASLGLDTAGSVGRLLILKVAKGTRIKIDPRAFVGKGTLILESAGTRLHFICGVWVRINGRCPVPVVPGAEDVTECFNLNSLWREQRMARWTIAENGPAYRLLQYHPRMAVHGVVPAFLRGIATEFRKVPDVVFANCSRLETLTFEVNVDDTFTLDLLRPCTSLRRIVFTGSGPELPDGAVLRRDAANRPIVIRLPNGRDYRIVKLDRQTVWETVGTPETTPPSPPEQTKPSAPAASDIPAAPAASDTPAAAAAAYQPDVDMKSARRVAKGEMTHLKVPDDLPVRRLIFREKKLSFEEGAFAFEPGTSRDARLELHFPADADVRIFRKSFSGPGTLVLCRGEKTLRLGPDGWQKADAAPTDVAGVVRVTADDPALQGTVWTIRKSGNTCELLKLDPGKLKHIRIPSQLDGLAVRTIGTFLCGGNRTLRSLVLPDSLRELRNGAFIRMAALEKIVFSRNIDWRTAPKWVCQWCTSLKEVRFTAPVDRLPPALFSHCTSLRRIVLPGTRLPDCSMRDFTEVFEAVPQGCSLHLEGNKMTYTLDTTVTEDGTEQSRFVGPEQNGDGGYSLFPLPGRECLFASRDDVVRFYDGAHWQPAVRYKSVLYSYMGEGLCARLCRDLTFWRRTLPAEVGGRPVTFFSDRLLSGCDKLERLSFEGDVVLLPAHFFRGAPNLRRIEFKKRAPAQSGDRFVLDNGKTYVRSTAGERTVWTLLEEKRR